MNLRTANHHRKTAQRRAVYEAAFYFHLARSVRLANKGQLWRLRDSGFVRRMKATRKRQERG